jgi:hypothetical protein
MTLYAIGNEEFLDMTAPDGVKKVVESIEHPGVNGTSFYDLGYHGANTIVRTKVDAVSKEATLDTFTRYAGMVGGYPVRIIYQGVDLSAYHVMYKVIDVRPLTLDGIGGGVGGLHFPTQGWVEAEWLLKPIPIN